MRRVQKKRVFFFATFLAVVVATVTYVLVMVNPVLIFNEAPGAEVFVDGKELDFERGSYTLYPWKRSYLVEVRAPSGRYKRRIYPWEGSSDSSSVFVKKDGVSFYVESVVVAD